MMFLKNTKVIPLYGKRIILSPNNLLKIPKRNGYLVLVPEIGEDLPGKYPLLKEDKSPEFNTVTIEKCVAAMGKQALEFEESIKTLGKEIENIDDVCPDNLFKNIINPIEEMSTSLSSTWGIAKVLYVGNQSKMPTQYYISINNRARNALANKYVSKPIYEACKSVINNHEIKLTNEQRRILEKFILEGKLNGLELSEKEKEKLSALMTSASKEINEYSGRLQIAVNRFRYTIRDPKLVEDFPEEVLKYMVPNSSQYKLGPWTLTLHPAVLKPFMEYCPDRGLRWNIWETDVSTGSVFSDKALQTSTKIEEIRFKRNEQAKLLGYKTYADMSMETKMAANVENVHHVLDNLLTTAYPAQKYEINELNTFANERGLEGKLKLWDIAFWSRKQLQSICKFKEEDLKNYFPLPKVLSGLFELIEMLFNVKIVEGKKPDVWHKDVRFFHVFDLKESSSNPVGSFYLDPYAREDEKVRMSEETGYMVTLQNRSKISDVKPLAALIFNFTPSLGEKPSLLSFKDLRTLFQKVGHMLQHILTTVEYAEVAGHSFMEWDAMFISDYFFENWLYEPFVLQQISGHQHTGEPLPADAIETVKIKKTHLAGYNLCKELYLSRFDLELYSGAKFWNDIMNKIWHKYFVIPQHKRDCHICSFDCIFSGDLAASYYGFVWSKMIAADLYSAFQNIPSSNKELLQEIGSRYRETYLAVGSSYSANEVFRKFRGRDPSPKALLKSLGLDVKAGMLENTDETIQTDAK
ncbi:LOW QUALITY PROTEIN: probable cytosolic oligopeptidase A [Osmia bicornis bicornis]|uniref:LOW QUALITY PROTEIN: probable cytosolic oligopeptidase A n=1 Tax=Osmia bicornis bicornis TaxID=1437191 RepID=UPI001EAF022A|nr:LOW QUALITY PROTEIN: probable cytosolic oligopeptidase A [Osmia bicornis bicornis]